LGRETLLYYQKFIFFDLRGSDSFLRSIAIFETCALSAYKKIPISLKVGIADANWQNERHESFIFAQHYLKNSVKAHAISWASILSARISFEISFVSSKGFNAFFNRLTVDLVKKQLLDSTN
jgi:hypothetical protein